VKTRGSSYTASVELARSPSRRRMSANLRIAVVHCLVFARQRSPNQQDEARQLANEGGRELKVIRELRCHAVGVRSAKPNATMNG
jgi:hypothetical protein